MAYPFFACTTKMMMAMTRMRHRMMATTIKAAMVRGIYWCLYSYNWTSIHKADGRSTSRSSMKLISRKIWCWKLLCNWAGVSAARPVKFQSDPTILNPYLAASKVREIWYLDVCISVCSVYHIRHAHVFCMFALYFIVIMPLVIRRLILNIFHILQAYFTSTETILGLSEPRACAVIVKGVDKIQRY